MADTKISALTAATTPLAGTEVLPIVQSGSTVKVANNDLRPKQIQSNATSGVLQIAGPGAAATRVMTTPDANFTAARTDAGQSFTGSQTFTNASNTQTTVSLINGTGYNLSTLTNFIFGAENSSSVDGGRTYQWNMGASGGALGKAVTWSTVDTSSGTVERFKFTPEGNIAFADGKGIDFSATPGTGTSELLDDYETGSWTPSLSSNSGSAGAAAVSSAYGIYTKVGNQVTISFSFQVDNVGSWTGAIQVAGIPFNFASGKVVIAATAVSNLTYVGQVAFEGALSAGDKLTLRTMSTASAYSQVNVSGISAGNTVLYGTLTYYV
jgi:hypothetical protein